MRAYHDTEQGLAFEKLEERIAMAASVTFENGVLDIQGTDSEDIVKVWIGTKNYIPQGVPQIIQGAQVVDPNWKLVVSVSQVVYTGVNGQQQRHEVQTVLKEFDIRNSSNPTPGVDTLNPLQLIRFNGGDSNDVFYNYTNSKYKTSLQGGDGNDTLWGGYGSDTILGGNGNDLIQGSRGDDELYGNRGFDVIYGSYDNDKINGGRENDFLFGDDGNDTLEGSYGNDMLLGGDDNDELYGDGGADGGPGGMDFLYGNAGDDLLDGGFDFHADYLNGGAGADRFVQHFVYNSLTNGLQQEREWMITDSNDRFESRIHWFSLRPLTGFRI